MIKIKLSTVNNWLDKNGYDRREEELIYDACLADIIENTGWYLGNLDFIKEFRVSWKNYSDNTPVLPLKHIKNRKAYKETVPIL